MIKVYITRVKKAGPLDRFFLKGRHKSFKNESAFVYLYKNPNSDRWIGIAEVNEITGMRERIVIGFEREQRFFLHHADIKDIIYIKNKNQLKRLLNGYPLNKESYFRYNELIQPS